jgi:hypothetical protein
MRVEQIDDNIYNLIMNTQSILCRTFMRFQEHYESPKYKGEIFSRREFKEWYKRDRGSDIFTYEVDWTGFNFPSWVLKPFYEGKFDPLLDCEKKLLEQFEHIKDERFYVIGTLPCDKEILIHEIAHGLWDCNEQYREEQQFIIDFHHIKPVDKLREHLIVMGYCQEVIEDEVHAYLMCEQEYMEWQGVYSKKFKSLEKRLTEVYNRYAPIKKEN